MSRLNRPTLGALFLVAIATYFSALKNQFPLDDAVILAHPLIQSLRTLPGALVSPWWYATNRLYRPFTLASFAVERAVVGPAPVYPHAVNIVLHALAVVLLACLLARFLPPIGAVAGALVFAVLPAHAEAVASIVGRAELLSAIALIALMLVVTGDNPPSRRDRFLACLLSAIALASKESGAAAPALVFAAAWARPNQRPFAARWVVSAAVGTVALLAARLAVLGTLGGEMRNPVFRAVTDGERIRLALAMIPRSTEMLLLPVRPAIDYVPALIQLHHPASWAVVLGLTLVVAVAAAMVFHLRRPSAAGLGAWITAATLAPTANLLFAGGVLLAGRTLYSPSLGAAFVVGAIVARIATGRRVWPVRAAVGVLVVISASVTWREAAVWRSSETVIAEMQVRHPEDYRSFSHLGYTARDHGNDAEAVKQFRQAAERFPGDPEMLTDAATVALRLHDTTTARAWLEQAIAVSPRAARGRTRLMSILLAKGDTAGARRLLMEGLEREPSQETWAKELRALGGPIEK
ncbi:MAG: hypothetical protein ABJF01_11575 [bacterium]